MANNVKDIVKRLLAERGSIRSGEVVEATGLTRQALQPYFQALLREGVLVRVGKGRGAHYRPAEGRQRLALDREGLSESDVFGELSAQWLDGEPVVAAQAKEIVEYAFTELLNNAIDHSESSQIEIAIERSEAQVGFEIVDFGVGVFTRIRLARGLPSDLEALQELSKGKLTTQPERHTGEGIFFASKSADLFELESGEVRWVVDNLRQENAIFSCPSRSGTRVRFSIAPQRQRRLQEIFEAYTEDFRFAKTRAVVKLFEHGTRFVSRSEAKRLLGELDRFSEVLVDFAGVDGVGQGFVDEIFRVWPAAHAGTRMTPVHMNAAVEFMVNRSLHT